MPRLDYKRCRQCRKHVSECGTLSHARLCGECGAVNLVENVAGLIAHAGPAFLRYRRAMVAAYGGVLLDDLEEMMQGGTDA